MTSKLKKMCNKILGDKMNLAERLDKQFPESSSYLYRQLGTGQVHHLNSHKTVYLTSLSGSFCHLVFQLAPHDINAPIAADALLALFIDLETFLGWTFWLVNGLG